MDIQTGKYDPLTHLADERFAGVRLRWGPTGEGRWATTQWWTTEAGTPMGTITLRRGLTSAETRSTLAHELVHVERGPCATTEAATDELVALDEGITDFVAAARLLPTAALAGLSEGVAHRGVETVALELEVDVRTVEVGIALAAAAAAWADADGDA
ncbi:hypothetical protein [uncultured Nocardioides sp.]|uniref:hypothetical protein n=1 Tax=uncultured Nocardioides sp. TaxID=198441 RepID=UPI0026265E8A|nr:hypothetical protein [uncultured Nocardioides sp.]